MNRWIIVVSLLIGWVGGSPVWGEQLTLPVPLHQANVRDFGAIGDGKSDDTEAIQKAINSQIKTRGIVFFPPGRYRCSNLHIRRSCILKGSGTNATKLIPKDANPVITAHGNKLVIQDLSIEHDRSFPANGILLADKLPIRWFTLQNIWICGLKGYALKTKKFVWESLITNCMFRFCGDKKVPVIWIVQNTGEKEGTNNLTFRDCKICWHHGVAISIKSDVAPGGWGGPCAGVRKIRILDCFIHGGVGYKPKPLKPIPVNSIEVDNYSDIYIDGCSIGVIASEHYGIKLDSSIDAKGKRARITNCLFNGCRKARGIYLGNVADTFIFANSFLPRMDFHIFISPKAIRTKILPQVQNEFHNPMVIMDKGANTYLLMGGKDSATSESEKLDAGKVPKDNRVD